MPQTACVVERQTELERPWQRDMPRAPRGDQSVSSTPPLAEARALVARNLASFGKSRCQIAGMPLAELREWTRQELVQAARRYTGELLAATGAPAELAEPLAAAPPMIVSGHQPSLFHPGVWVKNFVVGALARGEGGTGMNLVVDNDLMASRGILVPTGPADSPACQTVLFDEPRADEPWEEAGVVNEELFRSFAKRATALLASLNAESMLPVFWRDVLRAKERFARLACCLTAARRAREESFGTSNLELPLSMVCQTRPFLWFAAHLLWHLPQLHAIYNDVVAEYRRVHGIRSPVHPVPNLRSGEGWLEAPFWIWNRGDRVRRRLAVRWSRASLALLDRGQTIATLPPVDAGGAMEAVEVLSNLERQNLKLRTRALTTTLFARVCLADLFVHGIGGAKYDEIADRIMARFFELNPPAYLTLSATVHLPVKTFPVMADDARRYRRQLRELEYNSDRHLPPWAESQARPLLEEKQRLIEIQQAVRAGQTVRHDPRWTTLRGVHRLRRFQELNRALARLTEPDRRRIAAELRRTMAQLAANNVLQGREYAFCLNSEEKLRAFFEHVCASLG